MINKIYLRRSIEELICKYINSKRQKENIPLLTTAELNFFIEYNQQTIEIAINDLYKIIENESYILEKNINVPLPPRVNEEEWLLHFIKEYI